MRGPGAGARGWLSAGRGGGGRRLQNASDYLKKRLEDFYMKLDTVRPLAHNDTFSGLCVESACRVWSHRLRVESQAVESQTRTARA